VLMRGEFWIGVLAGAALFYFWKRYQDSKAQ
jgi:hypothetical protein